MEMRLKYLSPASRIREKRTYSIQLEDRLQNRLQAILRERRHNLALYIERMKAVSPLEKLNSGFPMWRIPMGKYPFRDPGRSRGAPADPDE